MGPFAVRTASSRLGEQTLEEKAVRVFLSLGSNLGRRRANLEAALGGLRERGIQVVRCSRFYRTQPVDLREQPDFFNLVCEVRWPGDPFRLLQLCLDVEEALGRRREIPKGPRVVDVDLLFFGDRIIRTPSLSIPHPALTRRRFVLVPLAEIAPRFRDPVSGKSVARLLRECPDRSWVRPAEGPQEHEHDG